MMIQKNISSMRSTIEWLKEEGELLTVSGEVDPIYEISGIQKKLENGPSLLFEKIKGYPEVRDVGNVFSRRERVAKLFGVEDHKKLKFKCLEAIRNPTPAKVVDEAPCQEVVITDNIDVMATLPMIKHTERDGGRILGSGNILISGNYFRGGSHLSFNRMHFRGKDWSSLLTGLDSHLGYSLLADHRGEKVPLTINIGTPPAVAIVAGGSGLHTIIPAGSDELGIAGRLQGSPIEIIKAKTVDAYAIGNSEWVIEGYADTGQRVWETEEAEKIKKYGVAPFFPEWPGYLGRAVQTVKFQVTAITHRKDKPIFYTPLAYSFESNNLYWILREACFYELAERLVPGLVIDVNILDGLTLGSIVFQVRKRRRSDDGHHRTLITASLGVRGERLVVVVDEDVDIYSAEDILWAIAQRVIPPKGLIIGGGRRRSEMVPGDRVVEEDIIYEGGLGIDATVPFAEKWQFERAKYPVDKVDLRKWFSKDQIDGVRSIQCEYAKISADRGG